MFLQNFLSTHHIRSVVDLGCGDWSFSKLINWKGITYTGYDIVESVIENNKRKYQTPTIQFICGNALDIDLPQADLFICKDVFQHLSNTDISTFIKQFSKYKYCLITNDIKDPSNANNFNVEMHRGGWRLIDLSLAPFHVPGKPILTYLADTSLGPYTKQVFFYENPSFKNR